MKKILIPIITFCVCFAVIWSWTNAFSSFTVFSYTLKEAGDTPRYFPDIKFINQNANVFDLKDKHKYVLMNFVYLNCPSVCHKVNNQLEEIYHLLDTSIVPSKLEFVTVSFDLKNDNLEKIEKYRDFFGDSIPGWAFALPYQTNEVQFRNFLKDIGIWAEEAPQTGIINHSIYLFLISPENKIIKTFDPARENNQQIINKLYQCIQEKPELSSIR
ncbi:MAG TPA: SCO family protein [Candidatus Kapabacteria bacterium]|nr:SCO family protein [Candidatus Kapabacteria bacterium]